MSFSNKHTRPIVLVCALLYLFVVLAIGSAHDCTKRISQHCQSNPVFEQACSLLHSTANDYIEADLNHPCAACRFINSHNGQVTSLQWNLPLSFFEKYLFQSYSTIRRDLDLTVFLVRAPPSFS